MTARMGLLEMSWLAKAQIQRMHADGIGVGDALEVLYNPTEYTLAKSNQIAEIAIPGLDSPLLQFVRGQTETMTVDLFFDSTDNGTGADAKSVTEKTDPFYKLIKIDAETHAPPIVLFTWGGDAFPGHRTDPAQASQARSGFKGVIESVRQRYTMFSSLGLPLRAVLSLVLKEYKTLPEQLSELGLMSPDRTKAHAVQSGQTITRIAELTTGNGADWRRIAEHNRIENPFDLLPGSILEVPAL
jgi:hypothetical protein